MSLEIITAAAEAAEELALVTVVEVEGSAPRHPGSKMVVRRSTSSAAGSGGASSGAAGSSAAGGGGVSSGAASNGSPPLSVLKGTVGGGKGEARAIALCGEAMGARSSRMLTLEFLGSEIEGSDMICGGTSRLIVEPLGGPQDPARAPYRLARERLVRGERTLLAKTLGPGGGPAAVAVLDENGAPLLGTLPAGHEPAITRALATGTAVLLRDYDLFLDPVFPDDKLLVLGGGYVGQAVAWHAARMGFAVTVADDRPEFSGAGRFPPGVQARCGAYTAIVESFPFDAATYVVMVTRGHLTDLECVRAVLRRSWRYAGFIGSARKARLLREQLTRDGFDAARIDQLHSPIGLRIGAETPDELAVSILAEIITVRRNVAQIAAAHRWEDAR